MRTLGLAFLLCTLACARKGDATSAALRPNLVVLIADDMDHGHFGFAGNPAAVTPHLDELAQQGTVFTHGFVPMSRCRPSQASLLTGRWPHQNGITFNVGTPTIDPAEALPNLLARAGYATIGEGKFWEGDPRRMGFSNEAIVNYETFVRTGQAHLFEFLAAETGERPFFVWWAPSLPHVPHDPPERLLARIAPEKIVVPEWLASPDARRERFLERERLSLAMGAWLDEGVGELVTELRARGEYENTLFVFLIDNGWANGSVSKGWGLDAGLRTPVVFAWPGKPDALAGGRRLADLVSPVDVYATLLDYAGVAPPPGCQGESLRARIEGRADAPAPREALYGALYPHTPTALPPDPARDAYGLWARTERWKYVLTLRGIGAEDSVRDNVPRNVYAIVTPPFERRRGDEELYDLAADPHERTNLAAEPEHRAVAARLRSEILAWWQATGGAPLDLP